MDRRATRGRNRLRRYTGSPCGRSLRRVATCPDARVRHLSARRLLMCLLGITWVGPVARAAGQAPADSVSRTEIVTGRVTSDSGVGIAGASIAVTMGPTRTSQMTTTDASGRWSTTFIGGTGDYLVHVVASGWQTFRKRVTRGDAGMPARGSSDSTFVVDATLHHARTPQLAAVRVEAQRQKPERRGGQSGPPLPDVGAAEEAVSGVIGNVLPSEAGSLIAAGLTTPGAVNDGAGLSVLGLGSGQTNATLGGLAFPGASLPRDAAISTKVTTSTYDPARGWFGGAQIATELTPGYLFSFRRGHITGDLPQLQATDEAGRRLGQRVTSLDLSLGGDGAWLDDRAVYNYGVQVSRRTQDAPTLFDGDVAALRAAGVSADSAGRLISELTTLGVPLGRADQQRSTDRASFVLRLDKPQMDFKSFEPTRTTYGVTAFGSRESSEGVGLSPTTTSGAGGRSLATSGGVQASYSAYVGPENWLADFRTGLSLSDEQNDPYLARAAGRVLVASDANNPTAPFQSATGLQSLLFGGNGYLESRRRTSLWESQAELRFFAPGRATHRLTLSADARLDGLHLDPAVDRYGTYSFASLADVENNAPTSYSRVLAAPAQHARVWNAYLALGDYWRVQSHLQLMYGVRVEGNRYLTRPSYNDALDAALGVRADQVPNSIGVSPRLGFTWNIGGAGDRYGFSALGSSRIVRASVLRGGLGEFRNMLGPGIVADVMNATGLANATNQLFCAGASVPKPDWSAANAPTSCLADAGGVAIADAAPSVRALSPAFTAPRSWRANLSWSSQYRGLAYGLEGIASLNVDQPSLTNVNFTGARQFTVPIEGRPIFVSPAAVVPTSGILDPVAARRDAAFGTVLVQSSDRRSLSRQLTLSLAPANPPLGTWILFGSYTLARTTDRQRGFDGAAFGDPRELRWGRGDLDVRHQFLLQGGYQWTGVALTAFARVQSGRPYTPMIGGDVNGDGLANDRAFSFDPSELRTAGDTALANELQRLGQRAPQSVRSCLEHATGHAFGRNACDGPWTATLNARLDLSAERLHLSHRATIGLTFQNILGGIDQLLHGNNLKGWGSPTLPDPVLYQIRGFDPATQRFHYQVNPQFGDTRPEAVAFRTPFRVTIDVRLDLSRPIAEQQLDQFLKPGRSGRPGPKLSAADLKRRYLRAVPDPYEAILAESDSLLLTHAQFDTLTRLDSIYRARMDSVWSPLVEYLTNLGDQYDAADALARQEAATDAAWENTRLELHRTLPTILLPIQRQLLPWPAGMLLREEKPSKIRVYSGG